MSTYEPGRLYLIDVDGETREARYFANGIHAPGFLTRDGQAIRISRVHNPRPAIVLDPEDENVKAFATGHGTVGHVHCCTVADKIRAQITPPEPPMEEPGWGEKVDDDRGHWLHAYGPVWTNAIGNTSAWAEMVNPRPYENPREKPATAPQSDEQGSGSGIGRVSESEAVEGGLDAWGKRMRGEDRP